LLKDLLKISKNRYPLLLEIKPLLTKLSLLSLIKLMKKTKKYGIFSFKEKNLINLYKCNSEKILVQSHMPYLPFLKNDEKKKYDKRVIKFLCE